MRRKDIQRLGDEELMALVADGEARALEAVYDRHAQAAFSLAYRIVGDRAAAEDVTQEAFLSVWRSGARFAPERGSVRTWLLGIVHNRAIDSVRRSSVHLRRRTGIEGLEERQEAAERTDQEVARREDQRTVRKALETLPEHQLRVVELAYFGGFTLSQIAEMLELPLGTVKGRMRLALDKLRHQITPEPT